MNTPLIKSLLLFILILVVILSSFAFAVRQHEEADNRIRFSLLNHEGQRVTENNFAGRHQLVFFGFTSCESFCPTQMAKLTRVMYELESSGHDERITPIFISIDPERDTPEKINEYLKYFHEQFVGLTGSRLALKSTADSFKTFLSTAPVNPQEDYQITHSSVVYVVDPFNRIIDFIPFEEDVDVMTQRIKKLL